MRNYPSGGYGYQPPQYGGYGVAAGASFQSLLSKVLTLLSLSMLVAGVGLVRAFSGPHGGRRPVDAGGICRRV